MATVRSANVAGVFYPDDPVELTQLIQGYLNNADIHEPAPKALIAPHAGYSYSGPVAASAYRQIQSIAKNITRVVILAPSHRLAFSGIAYSEADQFSTPLGRLSVDKSALSSIASLEQVILNESAFHKEHSIEVHLPFLQTIVPSFTIVPLLVGNATADQVSQVLETLWGDSETLIVISSDLSHYLHYDQAKRLDSETTESIEQLRPESLKSDQACGGIPIKGLLRSAQNHNMQVTTLDLRNSGDTAGPKDRVVGYGAYVFS